MEICCILYKINPGSYVLNQTNLRVSLRFGGMFV